MASQRARLGILGGLLQLILTINGVILALALVLAVPLYFVIKDLKRTAQRFGLSLDPSELTGEKEDAYIDAAKAVFSADPQVAVFVYGHTHAASVRQVMGHAAGSAIGHAVVNTGTWIKQFERVRPSFGLLPQVYVPSFSISFFRIHEADGEVVIAYQNIPKLPTSDLTLTQRLLTFRKRDPQTTTIPAQTVVGR